MPSSVKDRFTTDFEYFYFFTKEPKYYFEQQLEEYTKPLERWGGAKKKETDHLKENSPYSGAHREREMRPNPKGRNKRCVWRINTASYKGAHFAVFPRELAETPIKACCPKGGVVLDPFLGSGTTAVVAKELGRKYIGIEVNREYHKQALERLSKISERLL